MCSPVLGHRKAAKGIGNNTPEGSCVTCTKPSHSKSRQISPEMQYYPTAGLASTEPGFCMISYALGVMSAFSA